MKKRPTMIKFLNPEKPHLSFEEMMSVVSSLKECIDSANVNEIMNILKSRVDGYNPQS